MEQSRSTPIEMPGRFMTPDEVAADSAMTPEDVAYFQTELERIIEAERAAFDLTEE